MGVTAACTEKGVILRVAIIKKQHIPRLDLLFQAHRTCNQTEVNPNLVIAA